VKAATPGGWGPASLTAASVALRDPGRMVRLAQSWKGPGELLDSPAERITETLRIDASAGASLCSAIAGSGTGELEELARLGMSALTFTDGRYPPLLRAIPSPPPILFVRGDPGALAGRSVAVVGCRKATAYGRAVAEAVASSAAGAGLAVVSGGALGIDAAAHAAAAAVGFSVAVMGCGADIVYPPSHRSLLEAIRRSGCVVSEFAPGTTPMPYHFPQRNRVIAGMVERVVVVEAGRRSGALITAGFAADYGREVLAVPGALWAPQSEGCLALLADGATPLTDPEDVWRRYGLESPPQATPAFSDAEVAVLQALADGHETIDALQPASGLEAPAFLASLSSLEVQGAVRREPGGRLTLTTAFG
jgi:DNA processing protein